MDDSLQYMMRQAALGEVKQEEKKDQSRRRVHEVGWSLPPTLAYPYSNENQVPRPASAEPSRLVEDRRGGEGGGGGHHQGGDRRSFGNNSQKRLSHHGQLNERSKSHSKSSFSASHSSMNQVVSAAICPFSIFQSDTFAGFGHFSYIADIQ